MAIGTTFVFGPKRVSLVNFNKPCRHLPTQIQTLMDTLQKLIKKMIAIQLV